MQARPPPTPPPAAENEVVAALQLRRRLATAEQKLAVAESTAEIAASAQRDREALLTRQLELKLHAAQEKLRSEFDAELDRAKHAAVAQAERDAAELQLATSRAADSRVDQAYEESGMAGLVQAWLLRMSARDASQDMADSQDGTAQL